MLLDRIIKIALVEPNLSGHHIVYLKHFIQCLRRKGCDVTVYSSRSMDDPSLKIISYIKGWRLPKNPIIKKFLVGINWGIVIINWLLLRKQLSRGTDLVFFCCLDDYMNELMPKGLFEILFPYNFSGLLLTPRQTKKMFFFDRRNILKSKYCKSVAVLDEFCQDYLMSYQSNIVYFPDFSDESKPNTDYDLALKVREKAQGGGHRKQLAHLSEQRGGNRLDNSQGRSYTRKCKGDMLPVQRQTEYGQTPRIPDKQDI